MLSDRFIVEPLDGRHDRKSFSCGVEPLDRYLREQVSQDHKRGLAKPHILVDRASGGIAGYYTLSSYSIQFTTIPPEIARKLGRYPIVPAVLLGRLAVDQRYQGQHLGEFLLFDALRRAFAASRQDVAAWAVVVDAKGDSARSFYERYGFVRFTDDGYRLFFPMSRIAEAKL